jgi:hypothetical protein
MSIIDDIRNNRKKECETTGTIIGPESGSFGFTQEGGSCIIFCLALSASPTSSKQYQFIAHAAASGKDYFFLVCSVILPELLFQNPFVTERLL